MKEKEIKKGMKVKVFGQIEEVMAVEPLRVFTYQSAKRNVWYHPSYIHRVYSAVIECFRESRYSHYSEILENVTEADIESHLQELRNVGFWSFKVKKQ